MAYFSSYELKEFDAASLTGAYQTMGSPLSFPAYDGYVYNASDVEVYLSFDGTTNHMRIPSVTGIPISNYKWNLLKIEDSYILPKDAQVYIKQVTASGTGFISINFYTKSS